MAPDIPLRDTARRNVVVVRAGETSLHRNWLADNPDRTWDLVVSWYGDAPYTPVADETVVQVKGGKGDGNHETFRVLPDLANRYDYFWLPDDDIDATGPDIDRLFAIMAERGLDVAQPALTRDSYFTHPHTLVCPSFLLRYTTFVEVMAACLSRERLKQVLPLFRDNPSMYGIDFVWARLGTTVRNRAAIVDAVTVRHTRPPGRFLRRRLKDGRPERDLGAVLARYGVEPGRRFWCYAGLAADGITYRESRATRVFTALDVLSGARDVVQPKGRLMLLKHLKRRLPDLAPLRPVG